MILNVFSITELFIGSLSVILMTWGGILALSLALRWRHASTPEERTFLEDRSHLVLLVAVVVLGIRMVNWPLFYATLQSFVPDIDGAMCIFGVTQVEETLTRTSELLKPISFFLIGAWFALHLMDRTTKTSPLMARKLLFLSVTALVVVLDSALDIVQMIEIGPGRLVSCCTTVTDVLDRPTRLIPRSAFGPRYASILGYGFYTATILIMGGLAVVRSGIKPGPPPGWRRPVLGILFLCAIVNAVLFLLSQIEIYAPRIMNLPFHHCLYCLWQYVPDTILMYVLFIAATAATGWAFLLDLLGRTGESMETLHRYIRALYGFSLVCFAASLIMNTVHLVTA